MNKILAVAGLLSCYAANAAIVDHGTYFQDTDTGVYWLKLTETRDMAYDDVTAQLIAGAPLEGWRYASLQEVEDFIAGYGFPNQGRDCADGWGNYCDSVSKPERLENLIDLFGDTLDAGYDETDFQNDVSPSGAGGASGMLGQRGDPGGSYYYHVYEAQLFDGEFVDRVSGDFAIDYTDTIKVRWNTASSYGSSTLGSFLVRTTDPTVGLADPNDPNTLNVTLFDNLSPSELGLSAYLYCEQPGFYLAICGYNAYEWWATGAPDYTGQNYFGEFQLQNSSFDQEARPWVRMTGYDYTAGVCLAGDTDLGDGWCREELPAANFVLMPTRDTSNGNPYEISGGVISGTFINIGDNFKLDNVELEFIHSNIQIDFDPWNAANTVRPKSAYFVTVGVKTLSTADGDAIDFDATQIDPATVQLGPERTPNIALANQMDFDGDGDQDIVFGFRIENSGISCLDTSVTLVAKTLGGDPLADQDSITPVECEETIDIDVDPFNAVNTIRPNDSYNVTVAVLGMRTADGDAVDVTPGTGGADDVDAGSLGFGPAATGNNSAPIITDINGDSRDDMLVTFDAFDAGIACGDTELEMTGNKVSGIPIEGLDSIVTEDCETGGCHP
jgi:hypothetical protein